MKRLIVLILLTLSAAAVEQECNTTECKAYQRIFDARNHGVVPTLLQCKADLAAWKSGPPDLEERLSVEELTCVAQEAYLCSIKNELTYEEKYNLTTHEAFFLRELLSRAETVISRAHRNEEYLLAPTKKSGGTQ